MPRRLVPLAVSAVLAALAAWSCGGSSPSSWTPPAVPSPSPTSAPASGNPSAAACGLGPGSPSAQCGKEPSRLVSAVVAAMDRLVLERPGIFDTTVEAGPGTRQYRVLDKEAYLDGLVANLVAAGFCAERDLDDPDRERVLVKNDNAFSEGFDVLTNAGFMRRAGSHVETCAPASFPVENADRPPADSGCPAPYPPPISRMNCKLHLRGGDYDVLDSTAIVGHDAAYCAAIGYTDGRSLCPVRAEHGPEREACEAWRVGRARDSSRPGPTWTVRDAFCTGRASGCENHPTNQHQLLVYASGTYEVCAQTGSCCSVEVQR